MNNEKKIKIFIGLLCLVLVLVILAAVILIRRNPGQSPEQPSTQPTAQTGTPAPTDPTESSIPITDPTDATESTAPTPTAPPPTEGIVNETPAPPVDLPSSVVIPTQKDPQTGASAGIQFPCQIPDYDLTIEKLAPYNGIYVEDGTNVTVSGVAMLMVRNDGSYPVEYTQIRVEFPEGSLLFDITALPAGECIVVQEKTGKSVPAGTPLSATAMVVQRADMTLSPDKIQVTDNGNNTLTIRNLTDQTIPTVRVFYKHYMKEEDMFVGGIAFTVRITRLSAGGSVTIQPSHYTSQTSRVVMVLTYDAEV